MIYVMIVVLATFLVTAGSILGADCDSSIAAIRARCAGACAVSGGEPKHGDSGECFCTDGQNLRRELRGDLPKS